MNPSSPRTTYLVLPGMGPIRRVVSRRGPCPLTLSDYFFNPSGWLDAGRVNETTGRVERLTAPASVRAAFARAEPIRAPLLVCLPDEVAR